MSYLGALNSLFNPHSGLGGKGPSFAFRMAASRPSGSVQGPKLRSRPSLRIQDYSSAPGQGGAASAHSAQPLEVPASDPHSFSPSLLRRAHLNVLDP